MPREVSEGPAPDEFARAAILVFARSPRDEGSRKRLGHGTGLGTVAVATALLDHTLGVARGAGVDVVLSGDAEIADSYPADRVLVQRGSSFGSRLRNAVADTFALGYRRVVAIGADTPALSPALCRRALDALAAGDSRTVVLGPARDGGYYLIGFNRFDERAFAAIPWRTRHVLARTLRALRGAPIVRLPALTDADDDGSLRRAMGEARLARALALLSRLLAACVRAASARPSTRHLSTLGPALVPVRRGPPLFI